MELIWEELFKYMKSAYLASLGTLTTVQDQSERMLNMVIQQSTLWQDEAKRIIGEWTTNARVQRHEYQKRIEDSLKRLEVSFLKKTADK